MYRSHRKLAFLLSAAFCLLGALLLTGTASAQLSRVSIQVYDTDGEPLQDALVKLFNDDQISFEETQRTDKRGRARFSLVNGTVPYKVTIDLSGHQQIKSVIRPQVGSMTPVEFTMHKYAEVQQAAEAAASEGGEVKRSYTPAQEVFNRGVEAYKTGDLETAKTEFQQALQLDPELTAAHSALATLYLKAGDAQAALASAQQLTTAEPDNPRGWRLTFEAYRALGDDAAADDALDQLGKLERGVDDAAFMYNEGVEALKVGDLARGIERMESALKLDDSLMTARKALAIAYFNRQEWQQAVDNAEIYLQNDPGDVTIMKVRFDAYRGMGNEEKAREALAAVAEADPTVLIQGYLDSAQAKFDNGDAAGAVADLQQNLQIDPNHPESHYLLGLCYINLEQNDKAKEHFSRFLELAPNNPNAPTAKEMLSFL